MHLSLPLRRSLGVAAFLCAVPTFAFAATPQQELTAALANSLVYVPLRVDAAATINVVSKPVAKGTFAATATAHASAVERILSRDQANKQSEGTLTVDKYQNITKGPGAVAGLDAPIVVDWKKMNQSLYVRVHDLPNLLTSGISSSAQGQAILNAFLNQWISIDLTQVPTKSGASIIADAGMELLNPTSGNSFINIVFGKASPLIYTGVEKKATATDPILRVRARINPSFIAKMQKDELSTIQKERATDAMERSLKTQSIKDANVRYAQLRSLVAATKIAVNIDTKSHLIQRIEFGGTITQPNQDCTTTYRKTAITTCKTKTRDTITFNGGFSMKMDTAGAIVPPTDAKSIMDLVQIFMPAPATETTSTTPEVY